MKIQKTLNHIAVLTNKKKQTGSQAELHQQQSSKELRFQLVKERDTLELEVVQSGTG